MNEPRPQRRKKKNQIKKNPKNGRTISQRPSLIVTFFVGSISFFFIFIFIYFFILKLRSVLIDSTKSNVDDGTLTGPALPWRLASLAASVFTEFFFIVLCVCECVFACVCVCV